MSQANSGKAKETTMSGSISRFTRMAAIFSLVAAGAIGWAGPAAATPLYWDQNGITAGAGVDPTGTWGTSDFWNSDSTGGGGGAFQIPTANTDDLYFVAGPSGGSGSAAYVVTVSGAQAARSLNFQCSGTTTISGGTSITLGDGTPGAGGITMGQYAYAMTNQGAVTIGTPVTLNNSQTWTNNSAALLTVGTGAVTNGGFLLTVGGSGNTTITSGISGAGGITKTGAGTLSLSGNNSALGGGVSLEAGSLSISTSNAAFGTGVLNIGATSGSTAVTLDAASPCIITNAININQNFTYTGTSSLTQNTGAVALVGGSRTIAVSASTLTLGGNIGDAGNGYGLTKAGNGMLVLSGANSYAGTTTLSAGTLSVGASNNLGGVASNLVFNGGTLQITGAALTSFSGIGHTVSFTSGKTVGLDINAAGNTFMADQVLNQGTGGLTKAGTGTLVLNQANTYTGPTTISAGTLRLDDGGAMSPAPLLNTGTLAVNQSGTATQGATIPALISGTGSVANVGTGTLVLNAPNYHTGTTKASVGTITLSHALAIQNSALDTTGGGTVTLSDVTTPTFGGLSGATGNLGTVISSGYSSVTALTLNPQSGTVTYGGVIADGNTGMTLTKTGAGTQALQGANTYTGATTVNAGTLTLSGANGAIASTTINLNGGGLTLNNSLTGGNLGTRVSDSAAINVNGSSALNFTNSAGATNYAEIIGTLALQSGFLTYTGSQAALGQTSNLRFNTLSRGGTATVNFAGFNLGVSTRNTIKFGVGVTNGVDLGPWAVVGGADFATYDTTLGVKAAANSTLGGWSSDSATNFRMTGGGITIDPSLNPSYKTLLVSDGAVRTLSINGNTVSVGGISCAGGTTHIIDGAGAVQALAAGDPLYINVGASSALTLSSVIQNVGAGATASALVKYGTGTLTLGGTNTYSGGTVLNAGTVSIAADTNLGAANSTITFNGNATLGLTAAVTSARPITVNNGAVAVLNQLTAGGYISASGAITGNGGVAVNSSVANMQHGFAFTSTDNTFTGPLTIGGSNRGLTLTINSLADSPSPITFSTAGFGGGGDELFTLTYGSGAIVPLTLNSRRVIVDGVAYAVINNANTTQAMTINTDIGFIGTGARGLALSAEAGPTNVFAGRLTDNAGGTFSLTKSGGGVWAVSGANTYSGQTTISDGGGTMYFQNASNSLSKLSTVWIGGSAGMTLLDDGAGTINLGNNVQVGVAGKGERDGPTIFVGNNNTANGGNSSGTTTGSTIALGTFDLTYGDVRSTQIITVNGANGYRLQMGGLIIAKRADFGAPQLNPTTAPLTIVGTVTMASGKLAGENTAGDTLELTGSAAGNLISGSIQNAADYPTNPNAKPLNLLKSGTGDWTLSGTNTYTGVTTVNTGTLLVNGDSSAATGTVTVAAAGRLGGGGIIGGAVSVSGTLAPGDGAGTLTIGTPTVPETLMMAENSTYEWQLGVSTADKVVVTGVLELPVAWTLKLFDAGGTLGSSYDLFTFASFPDTLTSPTIDYGTTGWSGAAVALVGNRVVLQFGVPGDTNNDKVVDAADFITLKKNFGGGLGGEATVGNFDKTGTVDWADLNILTNNMGAPGGAAAVTPEPATLGLLAVGALAVLRRNRRS